MLNRFEPQKEESDTLRSQSIDSETDPLHLMFHVERRYMEGGRDGWMETKQSKADKWIHPYPASRNLTYCFSINLIDFINVI